MNDPIALTVSVLALSVSAVTAWLTLFRRGTVRMTQPTVIYLGPDLPRPGDKTGLPKIYLRALLFSTSKRGRVIESIHVSLERSETRQNFNIWVHGREKLVRGSGLYVGETGVAADHHFLTPKDGSAYRFMSGHYVLKVHARLLGDSSAIELFSQELEITPALAAQLDDAQSGLYFDWGPDSSRYHPHVERCAGLHDPASI
jgi:hypothetical protein